jgi:hypothetical protein
MALIDLVLVVFAIFLLTQVFLPLVLPNYFKMFWFFKKKKDIKEKVEETYNLREEIKTNLNDLKSEADKKLHETLETTDKISDLEDDYLMNKNKTK